MSKRNKIEKKRPIVSQETIDASLREAVAKSLAISKAKGKRCHRKGPKDTKRRTYQLAICYWLAGRVTGSVICRRLKDEYGVRMLQSTIVNNYSKGKKWRPIIAWFQHRIMIGIANIPIASKQVRLQHLDNMLKESLTWYTKSINAYGEINHVQVGVAVQILEQARKEIEGEKSDSVTNTNIFANLSRKEIYDPKRTTEELINDLQNRLKLQPR